MLRWQSFTSKTKDRCDLEDSLIFKLFNHQAYNTDEAKRFGVIDFIFMYYYFNLLKYVLLNNFRI